LNAIQGRFKLPDIGQGADTKINRTSVFPTDPSAQNKRPGRGHFFIRQVVASMAVANRSLS
jgi:hypothetical protein